MKFFVDAGHGGTETGAIGHGMIEKNINLIVASEVKRILELNGQSVIMSRTNDSTTPLEVRTTLANQSKADYFVSIHHNANNGVSAGAEVYASVLGGKGLLLAQTISSQFAISGRKSKVIQRDSENPNVGQDYYYVIRKTLMPAVITEFGYMDSGDYINFDTTFELLEEAKLIANGCLFIAGINNPIYSSTLTSVHWAQGSYDYLKSNGVVINESRFDDKITRGEAFSLLAQLLERKGGK